MPFSDLVAQVTDFLVLGGPVVSLIGALSVVALAIILIKLVQFLIEGRGASRRGRARRVALGAWPSYRGPTASCRCTRANRSGGVRGHVGRR